MAITLAFQANDEGSIPSTRYSWIFKMKMSKSQAGELGAEKMKEGAAERRQARVDKYNENPNLCNHCGVVLDYGSKHKKFCSSSCAAKHNNVERVKKSTKQCIVCQVEIPKRNKYCSIACQHEFQTGKIIENWIAGEHTGLTPVKKFLVREQEGKCAECGITDWNGKPLVLELEHKDGNSENNLKDNLCLLCPNCHSQTSTFKGRNKGNGRYIRRQRYKEDKSF